LKSEPKLRIPFLMGYLLAVKRMWSSAGRRMNRHRTLENKGREAALV
jgi:hypothetical protein